MAETEARPGLRKEDGPSVLVAMRTTIAEMEEGLEGCTYQGEDRGVAGCGSSQAGGRSPARAAAADGTTSPFE